MLERVLFYFYKSLALAAKPASTRMFRKWLVKAHESQGVKFPGMPDYIDPSAYLDPSGGLTIGDDVVISRSVTVLTHDWSCLKRKSIDFSKVDYRKLVFKPVTIGRGSFVGAGAIILPGSRIGEHCIVGAGAVVKGEIEDYAIVCGNPARAIGSTR